MDKNNLKAAFFDIDGTLYDLKNKKIHGSTIKIIRSIQNKGIKAAIASSRPLETMTIPHLWDIEWDGLITSNGQFIFEKNQKLIQKKVLSSYKLNQIFNIAHDHNIPIYAVGKYEFFTQTNKIVDEFKQHFHLNTNRIEKYSGQEIYLLTLISSGNVIPLFSNIKGIEISRNGLLNTDIFVENCTKATGISTLMKKWGFNSNEYLCFGDSPSDISMLKQASFGVAMGNSDKNTKKVADYICPPSYENGIARTLNTLFDITL